jgi:hypothetical protein
MTPSVAVAFMTKMKLIFETDANGNPQADTFLAFQNGSFPVGKEAFYFMEPAKHGLGPNETQQWMMNFDKTFNFVAAVDDVITSTSDDLDQVYYDTLKACVPASSSRTPEQEARYTAAVAFLEQLTPDDDGTPVRMLDNYQRYESLYKEVTSTYKNGKIAADSAEGEGADKIKQDWLVAEPVLKQACDTALLNWETKGHKTEVERQLGNFITLAGSSPLTTVATFKSDYELFGKATALDPAANEISYLPTQFSPINFYEDTVPWQTVSLDKAEINGLLARAPQHLKSLFALNANTDIENMTAEYTVVEIVRNWFHFQDFLLQRFWKLAPGAIPLADASGQGRLPAFPAKLLFVRNVKTVTKTVAGAQKLMSAQEPLRLSALLFAQAQPTAQTTLQSKSAVFQHQALLTEKKVSTFRLQQAKVAPAVGVSRLAGAVHTPALDVSAGSTSHLAVSSAARALALPIGGRLVRTPREVPARPAPTHLPTPANIPVRVVATPTVTPKPAANPTPAAPAAPVFETTVQKDMELLAFICRKLPVCPNPDPALSWE